MSPVTRPDSASANGSEFQKALRAAARNPDFAEVDWVALHRSIMGALQGKNHAPSQQLHEPDSAFGAHGGS
jgi:hypothetical protein